LCTQRGLRIPLLSAQDGNEALGLCPRVGALEGSRDAAPSDRARWQEVQFLNRALNRTRAIDTL
jgi:hypothetical protein